MLTRVLESEDEIVDERLVAIEEPGHVTDARFELEARIAGLDVALGDGPAALISIILSSLRVCTHNLGKLAKRSGTFGTSRELPHGNRIFAFGRCRV